jgi:RNA polymerase sigma-70 factor, ECF subfamily
MSAPLLDLYPKALPEVYGYLVARCGSRALAEDLTAETFMAAVLASRNGSVDTITTGWLIVVARRRLVDHWRHIELDRRTLESLDGQVSDSVDEWDSAFDVELVRDALTRIGPDHRAALTLRYLDGLPVREVAANLGRTIHGAESLLQRARASLRAAYLLEVNRGD